jgi:hypothetical protein
MGTNARPLGSKFGGLNILSLRKDDVSFPHDSDLWLAVQSMARGPAPRLTALGSVVRNAAWPVVIIP